MATTPQPHFTALTVGNGMMSCGIAREVKDRYAHWTTFDGVNRDNVSAIIADPVVLAGRINDSLKKAMKIWWQMSAIKFACTASSGDPNPGNPYPQEGSISQVLFESILPPARVCSPTELRSTSVQDPSSTLRYAVASVERSFYFTRLFYDGEFVGWGSFTGDRSAASFSFLSLEAAAAGVRSRTILCGLVQTEGANTSKITYDYDYVEIGGASFICEVRVETSTNNPPSRTVTTTIDATNTKAEATITYDDGGGEVFTNTCLAEIPDQANALEYFSFVT